jgi:hypothetical protein
MRPHPSGLADRETSPHATIGNLTPGGFADHLEPAREFAWCQVASCSEIRRSSIGKDRTAMAEGAWRKDAALEIQS